MTIEELRTLAIQQYDLFTTAQAEKLGLPRLKVHRLAQAGTIRLVRRGVYSTGPCQDDHLEELRAAWLSLDPTKTVAERLRDEGCAIVATSSAAYLHGIGNLMAYEHEFFSPKRKQSRAEDIRIRVRKMPPSDTEIREGLKVTTVTRTVLDLLADGEELEHISDLLLHAVQSNLTIDWKRLREESSRFEKVYGIDGSEIFSALFSAASNEVEQANFARAIAESSFPDIRQQVTEQWSKQLIPVIEQLKNSYPKFQAPAANIDMSQFIALQQSVNALVANTQQNVLPALETYIQTVEKLQKHTLTASAPRNEDR